ncbi:MAG TPA: T9SS type A sorting domain-containing protein [Candidatus Cloacimonadota bacterium]|nr:T9SS type A sorting domain-containing protein [Candidatus Cloacimonadota bacterium]
MKKYIILIGSLAAALCFAQPSIKINAGSILTTGDSYVTVNGGAVENASTGTPFSAVNTKTCPASTLTSFRGPEGVLDAVSINPSTNLGNTTVTVYSGSYHANTSSSVKQWWNINSTNDGQCSITFRFRNGYLLAPLTLANLAVYEYKTGWVKLSETITSSNVGTAFTDITFSGITLSSAKGSHPLIISDKNDNTLPVELSSFTAMVNGFNSIQLQWITHSETNVAGFRIYRGNTEALDSATLLNVFIPASNTSQTQAYVFTDTELTEPGIYFYWLENVDLDGGNNIYGPAQVNFTSPGGDSPELPIVEGINRIYPNPFNPQTSIRFGLETAAKVRILIYNNRGQIVRSLLSSNLSRGNHGLEWNGQDDAGRPCSSGLYLLRLQAGSKSYSKKMMLLK